MNIPEDIPKLVQIVYYEKNDLGLGDNPDYLQMLEEYAVNKGEKKEKAKIYRLKKPRNGLRGILTNADTSTKQNGEQRVRDTGTTIEVILMKDMGDGTVGFMDEEKYGKERVLKTSMPDNALARRILRQRIRLPQIFSTRWMIDKTIDELEELQRKELTEWQKSSWLSGELILLFDQNNETSLNGYRLYYDFSKGLCYEKREDADEG